MNDLPVVTLDDDAVGPVLAPSLKLVVLSGKDQGREIFLEAGQPLRVGSASENLLTLHDRRVSRHHVSFEATPAGVKVIDLGSRNGSFHEGAQFNEIVVGAGAVIRVGTTELQVASTERGGGLLPVEASKFGGLVGRSLPMRQLYALLQRASASQAAVLIHGETGAGKEICAEAIHARSPRAQAPFVVFDCAAVPPSLIESELFGHARGAFTGATNARDGAFVQAHGGTLFIDEIGELPIQLQPRLLRAIDRRQVKPLGAAAYRDVDVRVIAATHRDLKGEVAAGRFREDLYHRLTVVECTIPPLRRRKDDVPLLVSHLLGPMGPEVSPAALALLVEHEWPGNVRELRNVLERARSLVAPGCKLTPIELGFELDRAAEAVDENGFHDAKDRLITAWERRWVTDILKRAEGNVSRAARLGKLDRVSLHRLMKKHGIAHS
jgi:DNA-binding NtrC family response regulator